VIQCGLIISNTGDSCFPAGEILPGIEITANNAAGGQTVYIDPAAGFGNTIPMVGSNTFTDYTIINFPNNDVNSFGFDLIALTGGGNVEVRIFGDSGLIETLSVNATSQTFFGYIASEIVTSVELEDLTLGNVELIGMLAFGQCEGGGNPGDCVESVAQVGATEDGLNCAINAAFGASNDITVPADNSFVLNQITANILSNGDITLVNVLYYNDNAGLPGTQLDSEMGISTFVSDNIVGNAFGFDIHEIVFDVTPYTFNGEMGNDVTYWIELEVDNTAAAGGIYWEVTTDDMIGNPIALFDFGVWQYFDPTYEGVYTWTGDCEPVVSTEEDTIVGFTFYPNPAVDVIYLQADTTIDTVEIYNLLGQKVISQTIGSNTSQVDVSGLSTGTYLMNVSSEGIMSTHKVVKK